MIKLDEFIIDESLRKLLQPLTDDQENGLTESIKQFGLIDPIILWGKTVVDGISRVEICKDHGIKDVPTKQIEFKSIAEAARWRIERHQNRRQMNPFNRIEAALILFEGRLAEKAMFNKLDGSKKGGLANGSQENDEKAYEDIKASERAWVNDEIAAIAQSNPNYVSQVRNLLKAPVKNAKTIQELRNGTKSISCLREKIKFETVGLNDEKSSNTSPIDDELDSNDSTPGSLVKRYKEGQLIPKDFAKLYSYKQLEPKCKNSNQLILDVQSCFKMAKSYSETIDVFGLTAFLLKNFEGAFRRGFIDGRMNNEVDADSYFDKRSNEIKNHFLAFLEEQDSLTPSNIVHLEVTDEKKEA